MTVTELIEKHSKEIAFEEPHEVKISLKWFAIELLELVNKGEIVSMSGNEVDGITAIHTFKVAITNALEELRK